MKRAFAVVFVTALLLALAAGTLAAHAAEAPKSSGAFVRPTAQPTATPRPASKPAKKKDPKPSSVNISGRRIIEMQVDMNTWSHYVLWLKAVVEPSNAKTKLTWKSSDPKIVEVDQSGRLTSIGVGAATVTVKTSNGKKASVKVYTYMGGECGDNVNWKFDRKNRMTVSGKGAMKDYWQWSSYDYKYWDCITKKAKEIVIKKGVTQIGEKAFNVFDNVKKVTIAGSVRTIGPDAFENCKKLTTVKISNGLKKIDNYAFAGCQSLKSITLPKSLKNIEYAAFSGCNDKMIIKGYKNSYAEQYAKNLKIRFVAIG